MKLALILLSFDFEINKAYILIWLIKYLYLFVIMVLRGHCLTKDIDILHSYNDELYYNESYLVLLKI